jgi:hypothetical protein
VLLSRLDHRRVHVPSDMVVQDHALAHKYAVPVAEDAVIVTVKVQVPAVIPIPNGAGSIHAYPEGEEVVKVAIVVDDDTSGMTT